MRCIRNHDGTITIDAESAEKLARYVFFSDFVELGHDEVSPKQLPNFIDRLLISNAILGTDLSARIDELTSHDPNDETAGLPAMRRRLRDVFQLDSNQALK